MFVKITASGPRRYVQLVESFRDHNGQVKKRTVATLGRLDQLRGELDSVIDGLLKVAGRKPSVAPTVTFESARALGDVWTLNELWKSLGFSALRRVFRGTRHRTDIEALIRVMVFNRLCDPDSKLGVLRWLETVAFPDVEFTAVTHQQLLRSMDVLVDHRDAVDAIVSGLLRPMIDHDLSVVFYDLTTIHIEGLSETAGDVRQFGMSKDGAIARQFMLGVVQTANGLPIHHEVFDGNGAETKTLLPTLAKVMAKYPSVRRLILIADRGLLSLDNLSALRAVRLPSGAPLEFVIAVPGRRYAEFADLLAPLHEACCKDAREEVVGELAWEGLRLVVAHDPMRAAMQTKLRTDQIDALVSLGNEWAGKLDGQEIGVVRRGRKLSDSGAKARFFHAVSEAHLSKIIKVDLKSDLFTFDIDPSALALAEMIDGKLLLVTNTDELPATDVIARYKSLADIERGFRVLKSELEIAPVFHRLPDRIRAHASICFMALILHRVMRWRLRAAKADLSPERALESLRRIQHHRIRLNAAEPITGLSSITFEQAEVLSVLNVKKPVTPQQLALL